MPRLTTRDYKRSSRKSGIAKLKEFGLGVLVGAALASAAFLIAGAHARHRAAASAHARTDADSQDSAPHAPAPDDTSSNDSDAAAASGSKPAPQSAAAHGGANGGAQAQQYDFYRMLPRFRVPLPHDDEHASHAPPPAAGPPQRTAASDAAYVLQVGSYRSTAEADQIRARLARAGISAQVQRIVAGSRTLNRVRIGPLSEAQLVKVREQLRTTNIHALLIHADR